jgi:hypothetical protein
MNKLKSKLRLTKQNIFISLLVIFCLLEAVQMMDFARPLIPSFQYEPGNKYFVMRRNYLCAKTELMQQNVNEVYFLQTDAFTDMDFLFESFYASYILAPEILVTSDDQNPYAITVIAPENLNKITAENKYEILEQCGNSRVLVLKRKQ